MAVVRDAELLHMVMKRVRGSHSRKYRTHQREPIENRFVLFCDFALFSLPTTHVWMSSVLLLGGSEPDKEVFGVAPYHIQMFCSLYQRHDAIKH